ncbi:MAG: DUF533 domain-containing protein, partial [Primorskyibacter sp.]
MGLMSTLTKVALGYAAARGMDQMTRGGGLQSLLGGGARVAARDPMAQGQAQMIDSLSGNGATSMGGIMDQLKAKGLDIGALTGGAGSPIGQMMAQLQQHTGIDPAAMMGGMGAAMPGGIPAGMQGMAGMAGNMAGGMAGAASATGQGLGGMIDQFNLSETMPQAEETAGLMLRAMIQAAKCDGDISHDEKTRILEALGDDPDPSDADFLRMQLS